MLLLLLVLCAAVETGRGQADWGQCLSSQGNPHLSDPNARDDQQRGRLEFSLALLKKIALDDPAENVFMSPLSIYNTLLLAYFTAAGHTEKSLKKALSLPPNKEKTDMLKAYTLHKHNLAAGRYKSQVHSANRFFVSVDQTVKDCMAAIFYDEIETVDFSSKGIKKAIQSINNWVASHTNNKIKNIVKLENIAVNSQIVLANAAYFKGEWKNKFDPIDTKTAKFYISKNKTAMVPMMYQLNSFKHWRSDRIEAELLELPYLGPNANKSDISLILLLPDESNSQHPATDLVKRLDSATLLDIVKESRNPNNEDKVEVRLPKFSLERTLELSGILEDMGVGDLFQPTSNLSGLTGGPRIQLSNAIHKAKVKVDEFGTEAAAATVLSDTRISGGTFFCDRPFIYLLYDKKEDTLLFAGVYNYPS